MDFAKAVFFPKTGNRQSGLPGGRLPEEGDGALAERSPIAAMVSFRAETSGHRKLANDLRGIGVAFHRKRRDRLGFGGLLQLDNSG